MMLHDKYSKTGVDQWSVSQLDTARVSSAGSRF